MTASSISASSSSSHDVSNTEERVVRFDNKCILIPQSCLVKSRMGTKSYSLPLWKKKPSNSHSVSDSEQCGHVVLKVKIPSFSSKSRSPGKDCKNLQPLAPCLVHREPFAMRHPPSSAPPTTNTTASTSIPRSRTNHRHLSFPGTSRHQVTTIPLRPCCPDCVPITEESLKEGDSWKEHFTRGARRRRRSSTDSPISPQTAQPCHASTFMNADDCADNVLSDFHPRLPLAVDEVDKRRRSVDGDASKSLWHDISLAKQCYDAMAAAECSSAVALPGIAVRDEEEEDQLFPLPSLRRSPSVSPTASPLPSTSQLNAAAAGSKDSLLHLTMCSSPAGSSASDDSFYSIHTPVQAPASTASFVPPPPSPSSLSPNSFPIATASSPPSSLHSVSPSSSPMFLSVSPRSSPSLSSTSPRPRKASLSSSLIRVGVDVLKGVSSISLAGAPGLKI